MLKRVLIFLKSLIIWNLLIWIYSGMCWLVLNITVKSEFSTVVSFVYCAAIIFDLFKFLGLFYPVHPKVLDYVNDKH
jgi:hypothetical protein